jgi:hypothetical protein
MQASTRPGRCSSRPRSCSRPSWRTSPCGRRTGNRPAGSRRLPSWRPALSARAGLIGQAHGSGGRHVFPARRGRDGGRATDPPSTPPRVPRPRRDAIRLVLLAALCGRFDEKLTVRNYPASCSRPLAFLCCSARRSLQGPPSRRRLLRNEHGWPEGAPARGRWRPLIAERPPARSGAGSSAGGGADAARASWFPRPCSCTLGCQIGRPQARRT